jgi:glutathione S-transferase
MLTLHGFLFSGHDYRVRLALRELGLPFRYQEVDLLKGETRKADFLAKNPAGQVPVLDLDDGTRLIESNAILFYLGEGTHLLPTDKLAKTRVLQWMCFEQSNIGSVIGRARFRRTFPQVVPTRAEEFDAWLAHGTRALRVLDAELSQRPFIVGETLTIADLALYSYTHVAGAGGFDLTPFENVQRWFARIEARPAHVAIDVLPV